MSAADRTAAHERASALLSDYLDGELPEASRAEVAAHLAACTECRDTLEGLRAVVAAARALPDVPPARDLWPTIAARTTAATLSGARDRAAHTGSTMHDETRHAGRRAAAAALLLVVLGLAWWWSRSAAKAPTLPRFLLLLRVPASEAAPDTAPGAEPMAAGARSAIIARYAAWRREHAVLGEKLADSGGLLLTHEGAQPFAPEGDVIGGLFIIEAADEAAAVSIAATCPHLALGGRIELRPIEDT